MTPMNQTLGTAMDFQRDELARQIVDQQWAQNPQFQTRYGDAGHAKCVQDVKYNLAYLSQAITSDSPPLFATYIDWVKVLFEGLHIPTRELAESLTITGNLLQNRFPEATAVIRTFIDLGLKNLAEVPGGIPSFIDDSLALSALAQQYLDLLRHGERSVASRLILDAVAQGASIKNIYLQVFQPTQREIGRLWQMNQMTVAQEHYCTAATQLIMSQLYSEIFNAKRIGRRMVATGVAGELHEIGLRMVADFFEMEGWDTYYMGSDVPASNIVQTLIDRNADVLAISATMTFHVKLVPQLIERVRAADTGRRIKILVGGYPFNIEPELWKQVGADGTAANAGQAIDAANELMAA